MRMHNSYIEFKINYLIMIYSCPKTLGLNRKTLLMIHLQSLGSLYLILGLCMTGLCFPTRHVDSITWAELISDASYGQYLNHDLLRLTHENQAPI